MAAGNRNRHHAKKILKGEPKVLEHCDTCGKDREMTAAESTEHKNNCEKEQIKKQKRKEEKMRKNKAAGKTNSGRK
ncbi:hypothetical protein CASFOL_032455 [Castilleja foliolosa]|uniref:Uncharacterized protein n=1 Tax=Castilleja foliolosa TaxID=1961234 RepID=A0ABD3C235_9LAMI